MTIHLLRLLSLRRRNNWRSFYTTPKSLQFHVKNRKSGYPIKSDYVVERQSIWHQMRGGFRELKQESALFWEECKETMRMDPIMVLRDGEVDVKWKFDKNTNLMDEWVVSCDSDFDHGKSTADLKLTPHNTALFSGVIDTTAIKDGRPNQSGYCNIRTIQPRKSFYRSDVHDWGPYTHLILRIRGDGRNYMLNLHVKTTFDIFWNDLFHYVMYTRGGPYWQYVKIPFSKFFLSNSGRTQDIQGRVPAYNITAVSITASDGIAGTYSLELDFIGVERDETFVEDFAYELYNAPHPYYI